MTKFLWNWAQSSHNRDLDKLKIQLQNLESETGGTVCHYNVTFVTMMKSKICYKRSEIFWKVDVLLNNAAEISFRHRRLSANAFDTVIDIVLKGSKLYSRFWKTLDRYQTNLHYFLL
jgi:hypothetical protein